MGEVLSLELASTKANLEKVLEQNHSLEQTKKIAFQQHSLYEQEVRSLEGQVDNLKRVSTVTRRRPGQLGFALTNYVINGVIKICRCFIRVVVV